MKKLLAIFLIPALFLGSYLFADTETTASATGGLSQMIIVIGLAFVFFYFILYRPEKKRRKKAEQQRAAMKQGDRVTAMGILGEIDSVKENTVIVKMVDGSKVEFLKAAITNVETPADTKPQQA